MKISGFLGILTALSLPPLYLQPLLLLTFPAFFKLLEGAPPWRAFQISWWFGLGYFVGGLYWIAFALGVEIERFWWLIPFTVLGLPGLLAVFTGLAGLAFGFLRRHIPTRVGGYLLLCLCLSLAEGARGFILTGFPWNLLAYSWAWSLEFSQGVAYLGSYGMTVVTLIGAGLPLILAEIPLWGKGDGNHRRQTLLRCCLGAVILGGLWTGGALRVAALPPRFQEDVGLRLVQPHIPQKVKWKQEKRREIFETMLALSRLPSTIPLTHVLWPEEALTFFVAEHVFALSQIGKVAPRNGAVIFGLPRREKKGDTLLLKGSVMALGPDAQILGIYDKQHLVPFGEYVPLRFLFPTFVQKVTAGAIDYSAGQGRTLLNIPGAPPFRPLICYEGIFPGQVVRSEETRPQWLLSLTNDGWFGRSSGPYQHFQMTRFRAIEEGMPVVRVANNGISATIDPVGRLLSHMRLNERGVLDTRLPRPLASLPLYARYGNMLFWGLLIVLGMGLLLYSKRHDFREDQLHL